MAAVKENGQVLQYVSDELRNDKEVVLTAVKQSPASLNYASTRLQDKLSQRIVTIEDDEPSSQIVSIEDDNISPQTVSVEGDGKENTHNPKYYNDER